MIACRAHEIYDAVFFLIMKASFVITPINRICGTKRKMYELNEIRYIPWISTPRKTFVFGAIQTWGLERSYTNKSHLGAHLFIHRNTKRANHNVRLIWAVRNEFGAIRNAVRVCAVRCSARGSRLRCIFLSVRIKISKTVADRCLKLDSIAFKTSPLFTLLRKLSRRIATPRTEYDAIQDKLDFYQHLLHFCHLLSSSCI